MASLFLLSTVVVSCEFFFSIHYIEDYVSVKYVNKNSVVWKETYISQKSCLTQKFVPQTAN